MDVEDLAPALLATASLIRRANHVLNGEATHVDLKVDSGFERGSFNINLVVDQGFLEQAKTFLLNHPGIKDAKNIVETIFFYGGLPSMVFGGLFKLIKVLNGAKPDTVKFQKDGDIVTIGIGIREIKVTKNTYNLYLDPQIRRSADQMVAPLQGEGIDALEIRKGKEVERVDKEQVPAFHVSEIEGELLLDSTSEAWVSVIALSFNPNHKWKFSTGGSTFSANITDDDFWDRVPQTNSEILRGGSIACEVTHHDSQRRQRIAQNSLFDRKSHKPPKYRQANTPRHLLAFQMTPLPSNRYISHSANRLLP